VRILVADDDKMILKFVSDVLSEAGYEVMFAHDGPETLKKAANLSPDLIILDIVLPGSLGTEVCENLRKTPATTAIPVILVSSSVAETSGGGFPDHFKADDYLRKPLEPDDLLRKVKHLAGRKSRYAKSTSS
jgi:two-component system phosphate regulon response regulator PhoB